MDPPSPGLGLRSSPQPFHSSLLWKNRSFLVSASYNQKNKIGLDVQGQAGSLIRTVLRHVTSLPCASHTENNSR